MHSPTLSEAVPIDIMILLTLRNGGGTASLEQVRTSVQQQLPGRNPSTLSSVVDARVDYLVSKKTVLQNEDSPTITITESGLSILKGSGLSIPGG